MNYEALNILFEDEALLVCDKPAGLMVEPDRNNHPNLLQYARYYIKAQTGEKIPYVQHLHRLDRPTSGIVLFTKNKIHLKNLSEQFAQRKVDKYYIAITDNAPEQLEGTLENWLRKEKKKAMVVAEGTEYAEKALLEYAIKSRGNYFEWQIKLHTGRYHQIRAQLAHLNCPVTGDELYGSHEAYKPNSIALHAAKLTITHPVTNTTITFESKPSFNF